MPIHDWTRVDPGVFHHLHTTWIPDIMRALINGILPPGYYAMVEQVASGPIPDVLTLQRGSNGSAGGRAGPIPQPDASGLVALAEAPPQAMHRFTSPRDRYASRARAVVVRHSSDDRVVAIVEIVSPGNKASRDPFRTFVEKAVGWLRAGVHLLIVDLFPPGPHDPGGIHDSIWTEIGEEGYAPPADKPLTIASYIGGSEKEAFIKPAAVGDALPVMPLFLEPHGYVNLPLEPSYMSAYVTVPPRWREVLEGA